MPDLPKTREQLLEMGTVQEEDERIRCGICLQRYNSIPYYEQPLELACRHLIGQNCMLAWIDEGNTSCPTCRQQVFDNSHGGHGVDHGSNTEGFQPSAGLIAPRSFHGNPAAEIDPNDEREHWQRLLTEYHPGWQEGVRDIPELTEFLLQGEDQFIRLCEAIVQYIEDPSVMDPRHWLYERAPFHEVIALCTSEFFAQVMNGPDEAMKTMINSLVDLLPDPSPLLALKYWAREVPAWSQRYPYAMKGIDQNTGNRLEDYYQRITDSQKSLYRRIYGGSILLGTDQLRRNRIHQRHGRHLLRAWDEREHRYRLYNKLDDEERQYRSMTGRRRFSWGERDGMGPYITTRSPGYTTPGVFGAARPASALFPHLFRGNRRL
ncbi:MAG: hypothetical protein Q9219_003942 [cf. Caloplaca sp. 3 TL-2023]